MADKTIGSLPQAQTVDDASLFVCEQQGTAMKTTGAQWKGFAVNAVSQYVEPAQQAAQQAQQAAQQAQDAADSIGDSVSQAQTAAQQAQAAQQAVENLGVTSNTLPVGQGATVTKTVDETGAVTLAFGIPQGPQGPQGPEGPQGGPGATGPQGEPGEAATVEIGSVTTGAPGTSAEVTNSGTAKAAVLNFTIPQGPQGAKGDTGPQGPQGETGEGFVVKGYFATLSALQSGVPSPSAGDAYGVGSAEPYDIYIWDGVNSAWVNNGPLQGAKGPQGDPGSAATIEIGTVTTAPAGSDAAVTNSGTSSAAVLNFTIPQGATGPQGPAGVDGSPGPAGADGAPGAAGPAGANATINGVNALTLQVAGQLKASQVGSTYTIDGAFVPVVTLTSSDGQNFYGEIPGLEGQTVPPFVGVPNMTATNNLAYVYINSTNVGYAANYNLYANGSTATVTAGKEILVANKPVLLLSTPGYLGRLFNAALPPIIKNDTKPTNGSKNFVSSGGVYTALQGKVSTVSSATAGNVATFAEGGQIQDSGLSPEDFGKQDFVVTFSGNAPGPYSCDKTYAEISAAVESGKNVYGKYNYGVGDAVLPLNSVVTVPNNTFVFVALCVYVGFGRMWFSVDSAGAVQGFVSYQLTPSDIYIAPETDYTAARVRGISLQNTAPSTIPNGFLVGVYE